MDAQSSYVRTISVFAAVILAVFLLSGCSEKVIHIDNRQNISQESNEDIEIEEEEETNSSIKIGVITDIHRCEARSPGKINAARLSAFVNDVDNREVDFNVDLGDNIRYRMNYCYDDAPEELKWVLENLNTKAPLYHVLSDHDVDDLVSFEYWKEVTGTENTFYSFDFKDFHIIVLDTVSGDGELDEICEEDIACQSAKQEYEKRRDLLKDEQKLSKYLSENKTTKESVENQKIQFEEQLKTIRATGRELALIERRDKGSILQNQLDWLVEDLEKTDKQKVIIFSDHPLFVYQGKRKLYKILNVEKVMEILEKSGKQVVSISGETHEWHEENINGVQYYLIGRFGESEIGSWAIFHWDKFEDRLEKVEK